MKRGELFKELGRAVGSMAAFIEAIRMLFKEHDELRKEVAALRDRIARLENPHQ